MRGVPRSVSGSGSGSAPDGHSPKHPDPEASFTAGGGVEVRWSGSSPTSSVLFRRMNSALMYRSSSTLEIGPGE